MNRLGAATVVLALLCFPATLRASPATLAGTVFSEDNNRIEHADVKLCDAGGTRLGEEVTTDSGEFAFRGLARGPYTLEVSANGYQPQQIHVDLSFASERGIAIYLKDLNSAPRATAPGATVSTHEMSMPKAARNLVDAGKRKFWVDRNHDAGMQDLERAVSIAPGYYEAYYEIGMAHLALGRTDAAERSFRKSLETSAEKYGDAYVGLGSVLVNQAKMSDGEKALVRGVELSPKSSLGFYELGKLQLSQKRLEEAGKSAEQARSIAPNFASVYRLLANIHMQQKNYVALLEDIDAYVKLDPDSPAGVRAKQMREGVARKVSEESTGPVASKR